MQLEITKNQQEIKSHGCFEFPVFISYEQLKQYEHGSFIWHLHPEVELTLILDGEIIYQINNHTFHLKAGDGLFCNSNALHTGHMVNDQDCHYISITFHPRIIYGFEGSIVQHNYVTPLLKCEQLDSIVFHNTTEWAVPVLNAITRIVELQHEHQPGYEMQIQQQLSQIWLSIYQNTYSQLQTQPRPDSRSLDLERLRNVLSFIQTHYSEKITLNDISSQINICSSECCRLFKKYMQQSLFDYLLYYRVEKSLPLLKENRLSITEIAGQTGFSSPGYFSRVFHKQMHCSPSQYRKKG
ncbi:MAG: helix-turn-helix transcriptional regulator [Ruminococcus sp.]|nr:helix-turn-helix transcriptional regulator [Ruminococcus sp.]